MAVLAVCSLWRFASDRTVAQCERRIVTDTFGGVGGLPGIPGEVHASISWDPDGSGPAPARLVVGGAFIGAGSIATQNIAVWDGAEWQTLGSGLHGAILPPNAADSRIRALAVHQGSLVAAGRFTSAGDGSVVSHIARWSGAAWTPLGAGLNGEATALIVRGGDLIVGGSFTSAGAAPANRIARWDGASWHTIGGGLDGAVQTLAEFNGELVAAGAFATAGAGTIVVNNIARWDGNQWGPLGSGLEAMGTPVSVRSLTVFNGELVAAGDFARAGGLTALNAARWNGAAWQSFGPFSPASSPVVGVYDGNLYAGGYRRLWNPGGTSYVDYASVVRWTGSSWQSLVSIAPTVPGSAAGHVNALCVHDGNLFVGGQFTSLGSAPNHSLARWNGTAWGALGVGVRNQPTDYILSLTTFRGDLIAGGLFTTIGGTSANRVARWNGATWQRLGSGLNNWVQVVGHFNGELVVGGDFTAAGGTPANRIARWDGSTWRPFDTVGPNGVVYALAEWNGGFIIGGFFTSAGGASCSRIARWDGAAWQPLGAGMNGAVYDLSVYNGDLIAAGAFTTAGGAPANRIARWDGASWHPLGSGFESDVSTVAAYGGRLFAGGAFLAGGTSRVAVWDGTGWQPAGSLAGETNQHIHVLKVLDGRLWAGGWFTMVGGTAFKGLARWDDAGESWQPVAPVANGDFTNDLWSLAIHNGELVAAGVMDAVPGPQSTYFYSDWGRWTTTGAPWIAVPPADSAHACAGRQTTFTVTPAVGYPPAAYTWRHAGQPMSDGATSAGSIVSGAATRTLSLANLAAADVGLYDCVISNACGSSTSAAAAVNTCPGDADFNCALQPADVGTFVLVWFTSVQQGTLAGDFNGDGVVAPNDVAAFVAVWFGGLNGAC